jgi:hypothetical protein
MTISMPTSPFRRSARAARTLLEGQRKLAGTFVTASEHLRPRRNMQPLVTASPLGVSRQGQRQHRPAYRRQSGNSR